MGCVHSFRQRDAAARTQDEDVEPHVSTTSSASADTTDKMDRQTSPAYGSEVSDIDPMARRGSETSEFGRRGSETSEFGRRGSETSDMPGRRGSVNFYTMRTCTSFEAGAPDKRVSRLDVEFPMYVVPTSELRRLRKLVPHEEALAAGLVAQLDPELGQLVVFWSHEWLGRDHPDPDNVQLDCVHGFLSSVEAGPSGLRRLLEKSQHTVSASNLFEGLGMEESEFVESVCNGSHWIDYLCVPQDTSGGGEMQALAISSIAGYAAQSDLMMVLCPSSVHDTSHRSCDLGSWRKRGWCRLELLSMQWTHDNFPVMVMTAPDELRIGADLMAKKMTEADSPCNGNFSCCEFNHVIKGHSMQCDKHKVYPCLESLHDVRVRGVLRIYGESLQWRWVKAMRPIVLSGLYDTQDRPSVHSSTTPLHEFLAEYKLTVEATDEAENTALHWAAFLGNFQAVEELLGSSAAFQLIDGRNRRDMHQDIRLYSLLAGGGTTPIILAAERGFVEIVRSLATANADVNAETVYGATALNLAATRGHVDVVQDLLGQGARVDVPLNEQSRFFGHCIGFTPLHSAAIEGHEQIVQLLLAGGSSATQPSKYGATPLHCSVAVKERSNVVHALIIAKANLRARCYSDYPVVSWRSATALDVAMSKDFTTVVQLFIKSGTVEV